MSNLSKRVTDEINAEIGRQRISGREIARRLSVPVTTVNRWLRYETPMSIDQAGIVSTALGVRVDEIFSRANRREVATGTDSEQRVAVTAGVTGQFNPMVLRCVPDIPGKREISAPVPRADRVIFAVAS